MGGWFLLVLFLQAACATGSPGDRSRVRDRRDTVASGPGFATEYVVDILEPGSVATRPVPIPSAEFQRAVQRLVRDMRLGTKTPRQAAHELLRLPPSPDVPHVSVMGYWEVEHRGAVLSWTPLRQEGPVELTAAADAALKGQYLQWCAHRGGGDCLGLLDDGPSLRADDRRALALALAFGGVLDETRAALTADLLSVRAVVSMIVWTVALYCMMWVVPEPMTKAVAASLTLILMGYLGLETVWRLLGGWTRLVDTAHHATTFEELRAAGTEFGKVLGEDAARAMILAVAALSGHTLGQVLSRVKSLPRFELAGARFEARGAAVVVGRLEVAAPASEGALAQAVVATEWVALSPQGPLAVVLLKTGTGRGVGQAPGGRSAKAVIRHRGGNLQVELSDGQRWHLPRGKSAADIPAEDTVGDLLQEAVTKAARNWGPDKLSRNERDAIDEALTQGEYWLARLLEREARGRYVENEVSRRFKHVYHFSRSKGVDVEVPGGFKYEILSGSESNLARHGRRMAGEFFRMLTF
ncbi:hypothetical protein [Archangium primigenium]|uniref:SitA5 family polymorphic toxin n=1 Tax=[Archangium] primigenium TaxID=2792470 RepID=UPI001EF98A76|nr:hypothetical protein [Archangium primigenium]